MPTNLHLDDKLIEHASRIGKHKSKRAAVTAALEEYVRRHEQLKIIEAFGTIDYDPDWDYRISRGKMPAKALAKRPGRVAER